MFSLDPCDPLDDIGGIQNESRDPRSMTTKKTMETRLKDALAKANFTSLKDLFESFLGEKGKFTSQEVTDSGIESLIAASPLFSEEAIESSDVLRSTLLNRAITGQCTIPTDLRQYKVVIVKSNPINEG